MNIVMDASHDQMDRVNRATIRVDCTSPTGSRAEGRVGVRAGGAPDGKESGGMQVRREYDETSRQQ